MFDPRVMEYLRQKPQKRNAYSDPNLYASLAQAGAQIGAVGGQAADTSAVQNWAQNETRSRAAHDAAQSADRQRIAGYLDKANQIKSKRDNFLSDRNHNETINFDKEIRQRGYQAADAKSAATAEDKRYLRGVAQKNKDRIQGLKDEMNIYTAKSGVANAAKIEQAKDKAASDAQKEAEATKGMTNFGKALSKIKGAEEKKRVHVLSYGLAAADDMARHLFVKGGTAINPAIGKGDYERMVKAYSDAKSRILSGAALTEAEEARYAWEPPKFRDMTLNPRAAYKSMKEMWTFMANGLSLSGVDAQDALEHRAKIGSHFDGSMAYQQAIAKDLRQSPSSGTAYADENTPSNSARFKPGNTMTLPNGNKMRMNASGVWVRDLAQPSGGR